MDLPWKNSVLEDWSIVGMNHYHLEGQRRLFVSMAKGGRCIKAEGPDDTQVWDELVAKATDEDNRAWRETWDAPCTI